MQLDSTPPIFVLTGDNIVYLYTQKHEQNLELEYSSLNPGSALHCQNCLTF